MVTKWYRSGNEKESGKKLVKGRKKIGYSQVNNSIILRISYVYVTYILRIWYVIDSGKMVLIQISCNVFRSNTF